MELYFGDIDAVYMDAAATGFEKTEESEGEG